MMGSASIPCIRHRPRADLENRWVTKVAVGTARRSRDILSWTLHDEHEPQSPTAVMTASQVATFSNSSGATPLTDSFRK